MEDVETDERQISLTSVLNDYDIVNGPEAPIQECSENSPQSAHKKDNKTEISRTEFDPMIEEHATTKSVSPRTPYIRICPPVNCKEKIIICLDLNEEMETTCFRSRAGDKYSCLDLAKRAIKMFVMHKSSMSPKHEFAFLIFHEDSTMIQDFSSKPENIIRTLDDMEMMTRKSGPLDLDNLFQTIGENVELPTLPENPQVIPPPYSIRLLLIYGRSHSIPVGLGEKVQRMLETSPCFFTDVLYIHQPVSAENSCEEIFKKLCELDPIGLSYILGASKYTPIFNSAAKLLAHPLQRPLQDKAAYKIGSLPTFQDVE